MNNNNKKRVRKTPPVSFLSDWSSKDRPWDRHRHDAEQLQAVIENAEADEGWIRRQAERIGLCSPSLEYLLQADETTGEVGLKLSKARFCRVRSCPVCQWRRSLMWLARFYQGMPSATAKHPSGQWVFLTLTVRNCSTGSLKGELSAMGKAWQRLTQRKNGPFRAVLGWIRTVEITRSKTGEAHPHYHALLFVRPSYFGKDFITTEQWSEEWKTALKADYSPVVDVRKVRKSKKVTSIETDALSNAGAEVLKYAVKPSDMLADPKWAIEIIRQTFKTRAIASGGVLKDVLKIEQETNDDLLLKDGVDDVSSLEEESKIYFNYATFYHRYIKI